MDPATLILNAIPAQFALPAALLVIACKLVTVFVRPPAATSVWAIPFQIVTMIGLNIGWAANRLQVGKTGVMVPREEAPAAKAAIDAAGVPRVPGTVPPSHG